MLQTILRERWGFPFYVVSDWGAVHNTKEAINAGNDVCMGSDHYKNNLPGLVANSKVTEETINAAVRNVLRTKILAGMLDYYPKGAKELANSVEHVAICQESSRKSI
ncbi:MAG: glycosyl hydrolase, partial [Bacteroidales bacterium]|nr:glycosyl hydrolase [Bacteroidales bacterium]